MKTPLEHELGILRGITPAMRYTGSEAFENWQARARQKLAELIGLSFEKCPEEFTIEFTREAE
ncbi:MAG: hypothetical protein FWG05_02250, partial [Kiritimatiellaeota bacterium]|nr:hypothetical protein [Kiritimatiellota bacterium]